MTFTVWVWLGLLRNNTALVDSAQASQGEAPETRRWAIVRGLRRLHTEAQMSIYYTLDLGNGAVGGRPTSSPRADGPTYFVTTDTPQAAMHMTPAS